VTASLAPSDITRWRMHTLGLLGPGSASPAEAVARLGAAQSQDHALALWSIAQRVPGATAADVQRHLDEGQVLRTHVLRPTWHFVTPADIRWMLELTAPRVHVQNGTYYRRHGLDDQVLACAHAIIRAALSDGEHLTRAQLGDLLAAGGLALTAQAVGLVVMHAELEGVICSGRMRGSRQTYALVDDRAPVARELEGDAALAELTRRYFTGHGPATVRDYRWWSSLTLTQIDAGLELVGHELHRETVDGRTYLAAGPPPPSSTMATGGPVVRLLQPLDEYVVGYQESRDVIDVSGAEAARRLTAGLPSALVVVDGQIAGRWRRTVRIGWVDVEVVCHRPFDRVEMAALRAEADRHAAALDRAAQLSTSTL
jgi:hypothetical protein